MTVYAVAVATALWLPAFGMWAHSIPSQPTLDAILGAVTVGLSGGILLAAWAAAVTG